MSAQPPRPFGSLIGGNLSLDFVNTVGGRVGRSGIQRGRDYADHILDERLDSYRSLLRWGTLAGVLTARQARALADEASSRPGDAGAVLERARTLRESMYRVFKAAIDGWPSPPADLAILNREVRIARDHERLVATPRLAWRWNDDGAALDRVLWPVVQSATELLTGPALERVGQCPGERCGWLFLDTSRSRRRRWCDMSECGNLAKVRRFRAQQRRHPGVRS